MHFYSKVKQNIERQSLMRKNGWCFKPNFINKINFQSKSSGLHCPNIFEKIYQLHLKFQWISIQVKNLWENKVAKLIYINCRRLNICTDSHSSFFSRFWDDIKSYIVGYIVGYSTFFCQKRWDLFPYMRPDANWELRGSAYIFLRSGYFLYD